LENIREEEYEDKYDEEDSEAEITELPVHGCAGIDFWIPQLATSRMADSAVLTSETVTELPLDSPSVN